MTILLIGARGSGKTTVGRRLASDLWYQFADADAELVAQTGRSIAEVFATDGEAGFRSLETGVLHQLLCKKDYVVSLGGGVVVSEENRLAIRGSGHHVVYLKCEPAELHRRVANDPQTTQNRPPLTSISDPLLEIEHLLAVRESLYREVMTAELDVTRLTPADAARAIPRLLDPARLARRAIP